MKTLGKKREQLYIEIRRKKKFKFYKKSRSDLLKKQISIEGFIKQTTPEKPLKNKIEIQCSECVKHLLTIKELSFIASNRESSMTILNCVKYIKNFVHEGSSELGYILYVLFREKFFFLLMKTIQERYVFTFYKLFYSIGLLFETQLYDNIPGIEIIVGFV